MNKNILLDKKCIVKASVESVYKELTRLFKNKETVIDLEFSTDDSCYVFFGVTKNSIYICEFNKTIYKQFEYYEKISYEITLKDLKGLK